MTTIRVKPEELETVAKHIPDAEDACCRARISLSWELPSLVMEIPGVSSAAIHELTDELLHWLRRYEEKLNEAEELLYRTAAAIRQADQTLADNMKEFGLELLGWYDLQRLFGEYDPITGKRISGWDRLFVGGMLLLSIIPPAKGAAIAGKAGIKGAKAGGTATDVSKLFSQMKYVLRYDKILTSLQAVYHQVVKAPITNTIRSFKKQWNDLLDSVQSVQWQPAFTGIGPVSRTGIQETAEKVTSSVRFSISQAEDGVIGKGTGDVAEGTRKTTKVNYGDHYTKVDGKKALKPDIEYTTNEGYRYKTDSNGRISSAEANLQLGKAPRNQYAQRTVGGWDRLPKDEGGHLIASIFKGSGDIDNLVPMNATLNRSEYKTLENTWKKALEEGKIVEVKIEPIYKGNSTRPFKFEVEYKINGKKYEVNLTNYEGGQ
jgi:hypothetical protein